MLPSSFPANLQVSHEASNVSFGGSGRFSAIGNCCGICRVEGGVA